MLLISDIRHHIVGRLLFDGASATIHKGERVGLIGPNGSGKTTLLRMIAGDNAPESGEIRLTGRLTIGQVAQEAPANQDSLITTVLAADKELAALTAELDQTPAPERLAEIHDRLIAIKAESATARAARILAGLGFDEAAQQGCTADLSGGWRMRVALAALLFRAPDFLLLDEPTNHLDLEASLWLEGFLKSYPGTVLLVSHDRTLLNRAVKRILHLENGKLIAYRGNYDTFEKTRRERQAHQAALQKRQMSERRHIQAFVDRFRYKASKARQAQSRLKALARMEPIASVVDAATPHFDFPDTDLLAPPLFAIDGAVVGYEPGKAILQGVDLRLDPDDRVALLGANGNGKSTLMKLFAGRLKISEGIFTKPPKLKVGYFAQDQMEELDPTATALDHLQRRRPKAETTILRSHLGRFGLSDDRALTKVARLSGGEKARLLLALMCDTAPQLLLLDEPTNHLDVDSRQALIQALNEFPGAVVLVSHDAHLVELVADRLWLVDHGTVQPFDGDLQDYERLVLDQRRGQSAKRLAKGVAAEAAPPRSRKAQRQAKAQARAERAPLAQQARKAEAEIERLQQAKARLEAQMADPALYHNDADTLSDLQRQHGQVQAALAAAEESWLAAQTALEQA